MDDPRREALLRLREEMKAPTFTERLRAMLAGDENAELTDEEEKIAKTFDLKTIIESMRQ